VMNLGRRNRSGMKSSRLAQSAIQSI